MSDFKIYGALFKENPDKQRERLGDKYDPTKNYPQYSGNLDLTPDAAMALVDYLTSATPDENGKIRLPLAGWAKDTKNGQKYLSFQASAPRAKSASQPAIDEAIF